MQSWDQNAGLWIEAVRGGHIKSRQRVTNDAVVEAVLRHSPQRVLDVGCGEGWLAAALVERCLEVVGFDGSAELIGAARQAAPGAALHELGYEAFRADPGQVGTGFDAAVANFSLFDRDLRPLLAAVGSVLRTAGVLVIQTLHPSAAEGGWQTERFDSLSGLGQWAPMEWFSRSVDDWVGELREAGFDRVQIEEPRAAADVPPASLLLSAYRWK